MGRKVASHVVEEGYYEDDGSLDGFVEELDGPEPFPARVVAVFGTSYGLSLGVHVGLLLVLGLIVIATPPAPKEVAIQVRPPQPVPVVDETLPPDVRDQPPIDRPVEEPVERPIEEKVEVPEPAEVPQGEETRATNRDLPDTHRDDAFGVQGPGLAGRYGHRLGDGVATGEGETPGSRDSKDAALRWLVRHQAPDGRWEGDGWPGRCGEEPGCLTLERRDRERELSGDTDYDAGLTALALLAFLGDGQTHRFGRYQPTVARGLAWLRRQQARDGAVGYRHENPRETVYSHAIATMALCEAYAITRDPGLRRPAQRALDWCVSAQNPGLGWRYEPRCGRNDTSVTGWMVLALKAGRVAGLEVPDDAFAGAVAWFERATSTDGHTGYQTPGGGSSFLQPNDGLYDEAPVNTAVAALGQVFCGARRTADPVRKAARILAAAPPRWSDGSRRTVNFYYWYYGTYAMYQVGGPAWKAWSQALLDALLPNQRTDGCARGSWDPLGPWCLRGGRLYATAMGALTLEVYKRYLRAGDPEVEVAQGR